MLHCEEGNLKEVRRLVERSGADLDIEMTTNENGLTCMALAVKNKQVEVAKYLIKMGANVNSLNKAKQSILFNACYENYLEGARLLLSNGA